MSGCTSMRVSLSKRVRNLKAYQKMKGVAVRSLKGRRREQRASREKKRNTADNGRASVCNGSSLEWAAGVVAKEPARQATPRPRYKKRAAQVKQENEGGQESPVSRARRSHHCVHSGALTAPFASSLPKCRSRAGLSPFPTHHQRGRGAHNATPPLRYDVVFSPWRGN
jgi:hypothetical protein